MSDLTFVQGDTEPPLEGFLFLEADQETPIDLTGCTVNFQMRKPDDRRFTVNAEADVVEATAGTVRYEWGTNDLAVPGDYLVQWEITYTDGGIQTQATPSTLTVRRQ